jgi:membrane protein implicated in regulation of membrane protease activity
MLTRAQFLLMLLLSVCGTLFAIYLPAMIDWSDKLELSALFVSVGAILAYIFWCGWQEKREQEELERRDHEERKERVARMIMDAERRNKLQKTKETV